MTLPFCATIVTPFFRFEIEKKLRLQRKAERAKEKPPSKWKDEQSKSSHIYSSIDHKERSKERKKNIEENRGKVDKRVNAMAELKARREGKQKREEQESIRREEQRKKDEEDAVLGTSKNAIKLKASDIYSDDSESEGTHTFIQFQTLFPVVILYSPHKFKFILFRFQVVRAHQRRRHGRQ